MYCTSLGMVTNLGGAEIGHFNVFSFRIILHTHTYIYKKRKNYPLTVDVQMKPRSVLVGRRPVEKHHFARVPTLVRFLYVGQVERSKTVWRVWRDPSHPAFVSRTAVSGIVVVPNEDRYVKTLQ